uniref:Uncharacterized protein n=1 Tax=Caenorhabditis tropicalis TaxID=1561998 RepID=A0A1I7UV58_9PELO
MSAQAVVPAPMEPRPPPADPVNPTMIIQLQRENEMLQQQLERLQQQREELRFQQRRQEIELVMEQQERRRDNELRRAHEDLFRRDARWPRLAIIERVGDQAPRAQPNIWVGPDERPARVEPQVPREEPLIEELEPVIEELEAPAEEPQEAGEEPRPPEEDIAPRGRPQRARRAPARHNPIENSNNARRRRGGIFDPFFLETYFLKQGDTEEIDVSTIGLLIFRRATFTDNLIL